MKDTLMMTRIAAVFSPFASSLSTSSRQRRLPLGQHGSGAFPFGRLWAAVACSTFLLISIGCITGCSQDGPTTKPATEYEQQEKAMKDPFNYSPDISGTDISGGGIGNFDRAAMRKDLDDVLNP